MFNKSIDSFPSKQDMVFLSHCSISPLYSGAAQAMKEFVTDMSGQGFGFLPKYLDQLPRLHHNFAKFLKTIPANISYVHNTAEAMSMVANGYPFRQGDEVISYMHEYPSNHHPWRMQESRGVKLVLLSDRCDVVDLPRVSGPRAWSMNELEALVNERTRMVAISHVQFSSGYAADLKELGAFCRERSIDLVVDCAQSLGALPIYPEEYNISAIGASAWKWMMGPWGSGLLYTSEEFREKLSITMAGANLMQQGLDYLDLQWNPITDGRMFEYSTLPWDHIAGLNVLLEEVFLKYDMEAIRDENFRLQDLILDHLDTSKLYLLQFPRANRSGILAAEPKPRGGHKKIVDKLLQKKVMLTAPIGYLRFAPHFYNDDEQIKTAAGKFNEVSEV